MQLSSKGNVDAFDRKTVIAARIQEHLCAKMFNSPFLTLYKIEPSNLRDIARRTSYNSNATSELKSAILAKSISTK